ncbi:phage tail protein [Klebsiella pneumoniae]|nr:phage tail protein [Klebsiella pneumoniae]
MTFLELLPRIVGRWTVRSLVWLKYREKYGPLNIMMRTEWGASLVASVLANINKAKNTPPFKVSDFAPHINEAPLSLEEAMKSWV